MLTNIKKNVRRDIHRECELKKTEDEDMIVGEMEALC